MLLNQVSNEGISATLKQHFAADEIYVRARPLPPSACCGAERTLTYRNALRGPLGAQVYIGHVLVSVNPYKEIRGLYTDATLKKYKGRLPYENPPHVYAVAESVHRTMTQQRCVCERAGAGGAPRAVRA